MKIIGIEDQDEKMKKVNRKKIILASMISVMVITLIVVICLYVANKPFRDFLDKYIFMKNVSENNLASIAIEEADTDNVFAYDKYITVLKNNILTGYTSSGKEEYTLDVEISNAITDANGKFFLIGEKDKQKLYLIAGNRKVWETQVEGNLSRICVNKNGYVAVILSGTTYKSVIQIFDATGKEMFKTYLSNSIAMDVDISADNRYVSFVEVSTNGTLLQSKIKTISIEKAKETPGEAFVYTSETQNNRLPLDMKYQEQNRLVCLYDDNIQVIQDGHQEELVSLNEENKKINYADISLTNYAVRIIEKTSLLSTEDTVEIIQVSSKKTNIYTLEGATRELNCYGNTIALNLGSEVHFIGTNGWLLKKYTSSQEMKKMVMCDECAGIVYRDKIEIVHF